MGNNSPFGIDNDNKYMEKALILAQRAFDADEVPVGAIVVNSQGKIIGRGRNKVEEHHTQIAHAECNAIAQAGKKIGDWRLEGCWIYVTLEPCSLCMHLILMSRLKGVVFGASSPLFGFRLGLKEPLSLDKKGNLMVIPNISAPRAATLLKTFFKHRRKA